MTPEEMMEARNEAAELSDVIIEQLGDRTGELGDKIAALLQHYTQGEGLATLLFLVATHTDLIMPEGPDIFAAACGITIQRIYSQEDNDGPRH